MAFGVLPINISDNHVITNSLHRNLVDLAILLEVRRRHRHHLCRLCYLLRLGNSKGGLVWLCHYFSILSDLRPINVYCLALSQINSLRQCCFEDMNYVTLAVKDANSKLIDVVTSANVDIEENFDDRLVITWQQIFSSFFVFQCLATASNTL